MFECPELPLRDFQQLRTPLPPKIIQLRRISQENHVRRMKTAYLTKEQSATSNVFSSSLASTPKSHSNGFGTPFTTATCLNSSIHSQRSVSENSSSNYFTPSVKVAHKGDGNTDTKLVCKKCRCICGGPKDREKYISGAGDFNSNVKPRRHSSDIDGNTRQPVKSANENLPSACRTNEKRRLEFGKKMVTPDSTKQNEGRKNSERICSCGKTKFFESPARGVLYERTCLSSSKIPIALSRLSAKKGCKIKSPSEKYHQNNADDTDENSPSVSRAGDKGRFKTGKNTVTPDSTKPKYKDIKTSESSLDGHQAEKSEKRFSNFKNSTKETAGEGRKISKQFNSCEKAKIFESPVRHVLRERISGSASKIPIALPKLSLNEEFGKVESPSSEKYHKFQKSANDTDSVSSSEEENSSKSSCRTLRSETKTTGEHCKKPSKSFSPVIGFFSMEDSLGIGEGRLPDGSKVSIDVCNWLSTGKMGDCNRVNKINHDKDEGQLRDDETYAASSYHSIPQSSSKSETMTENLQQNDCASEYFDIEEVESGEFNADNLYSVRRELLIDDDKSTVTIPSDEDLDLQEYMETTFRGLPGYPNTPYYLRYPRYLMKEDENVIRSDGKEMSDALRQMRIRNHVNRSSTSTSMRKKNNKIKIGSKNKKHLYGIKHHA